MIKIKDLEEYFGKTFDEILKDNDIVMVADDIKGAWEDYCNWEKGENAFTWETEDDINKYLNSIKKDFYKWVEKCSADELFNYELSTYQRHFKLLDNGKVYYLNSYI